MNTVCLKGRLGKDVETRTVGANNTTVGSVGIAVPRYAGGKTETTWVRLKFFGKQAEFASRYFHKGDEILVTGRLQSSEWTDKNGQNRQNMEVVVNEVDFCGGKNNSSQPQPQSQPGQAQPSGYQAQPSGYGNVTQGNFPQSQFAELADDDGELPF